jgi:hypothetical protein
MGRRADTSERLQAVEIVSRSMLVTADGRPVHAASQHVSGTQTKDGRPIRAVSISAGTAADGGEIIPYAIYPFGVTVTPDGRPVEALQFFDASGAVASISGLSGDGVTPTALGDGTTWTAASGVSVANAGAFTKPHPSGRTTGVVLTKNPTTGTFGGARRPVLTAFKMSDYAFLGLDVLPTMISGSVSLRVSSDNFATKRMEYTWALPGQVYVGDWNRLVARTNADASGIDPNGAWVVTGGMTTAETVNALQLSINTTANDAGKIELDRVFGFVGQPAKGAVLFGFDRYEDTSIGLLALPIAQELGITCYAAGDTDKVVGLGAAWTRVKALHDAGWPILSQGPDHKNYVSVGAPQLAIDYPISRNALQSVGLTNALDFFAYPFSSNNAATDAVLLAAGCKWASTSIAWNNHPNEFNLGFKLVGTARVNIGGMTVAQVKLLIDRAALYGIVLDLFCHGLIAGGNSTTAYTTDTLLYYANDWRTIILYALVYQTGQLITVTDPVALFDSRGSMPLAA